MKWLLSFKTWHKVVLGIILFVLILLFAAPRIARKYIVSHSMELIGRKLDIDRIRINYFTGTVRIDSLVLYEKNPDSAFMGFKRLRVNFNYWPLIRNEIHVSSITLENPRFQVLQNGDWFNFSDLIAEESDSVEEEDTTAGPPVKYVLNNIQIMHGYMRYSDLQLGNTIALKNLDLVIPGFTWNSDTSNLDVNFRFVDGGGLDAGLTINQADSTYSVHLKLDSLNLDILQPYIVSTLNISALRGFLSNDITIQGSMQHIMQLFVRGLNQVNDFQLVDMQERTILAFKSLTVILDTLLVDKNLIKLDRIDLAEPFIWFELVDSTNNWMTLMKPSEKEPGDSLAPADSVPETGPVFSFARLNITGGTVRFSDKTLRYPFDYSIGNINLEGQPAGASGQLKFHLSALLNTTAGFVSDVVLNPEDLSSMDIAMSVKQFRMKDVDAYFRHYFGFPVTGGILTFSTDNLLRVRSLESNNQVYFRKFTLGERTRDKSIFSLPLRLALGIMSDKNGIIDLKAPFVMQGEEIKVRDLTKIVFRIIGKFFIKAATAPYELFAEMYNTDPNRLKEIALHPYEPMPDEKNMETLDIIADILNKKPALKVDFYYFIDQHRATDTLAYVMAYQDFNRYRASQSPTSDESDSTFRVFMLGNIPAAGASSDTSLTGICRSYIGEDRLKFRIDSMKAVRVGFVQEYLTREKQIGINRFTISDPPSDTIRSAESLAAFMIYFAAIGESETPADTTQNK